MGCCASRTVSAGSRSSPPAQPEPYTAAITGASQADLAAAQAQLVDFQMQARAGLESLQKLKDSASVGRGNTDPSVSTASSVEIASGAESNPDEPDEESMAQLLDLQAQAQAALAALANLQDSVMAQIPADASGSTAVDNKAAP